MKSSIRNKLILSIALPFLIIFIAAEGVTLGLLSKRAEQTLHDQSILIAKNLAERMDSQFREVAQIAHSTALYMETFSEADDAQLYEILTTNIERSPLIYGSAIAFAPFEYDENIGLYSPYVYRDRESMKLLDIARDSYDYTDENWEWYSGPQQSGNAIWTTPFFDEGAGNILMITYAVPFYREDTFRGVATIDVPVDKLQELLAIDELQEFPFVIISAAGQFITHPDKNMIMSTSIMDFMNQKHMSEFDNIANELFMGKTGIGMVDNSLISPNLGEGKSWIFYSPIKSTNWVFATAVPEEVILSNLRSSLQLAAVGGIIMIILVLATILIISTHITKPITEMASAVADLSRGNLDTHVKGITTTDEIGQLAQGFNRMVDRLNITINEKAIINAQRESVESEIRMAREIQSSLLPHRVPPFPDNNEIELHAIYLAANRVAGDFFDYFFIDDEHLILVMADVSGKGVAAAMVMAVARTIIRNLSFTGRSPADILTETNKLLVETNNQPIFVTIFLACYNIKDGSLLYANGGHNPAYKITRDGKLVHFGEATGTIVGMLEDLSYENSDIFIHPDEYLVLYTDGLPEARSPDGNFYGETHFQGALESNFGCSARDFCEVVVSEVTSFQARELNDDVTLLIMKRLS